MRLSVIPANPGSGPGRALESSEPLAKVAYSVIPVKAGIQLFQDVLSA